MPNDMITNCRIREKAIDAGIILAMCLILIIYSYIANAQSHSAKTAGEEGTAGKTVTVAMLAVKFQNPLWE
jgi:hypothetical protein